jgi:hypothetical protein
MGPGYPRSGVSSASSQTRGPSVAPPDQLEVGVGAPLGNRASAAPRPGGLREVTEPVERPDQPQAAAAVERVEARGVESGWETTRDVPGAGGVVLGKRPKRRRFKPRGGSVGQHGPEHRDPRTGRRRPRRWGRTPLTRAPGSPWAILGSNQ